MGSHPVNLAFRFLLELTALAAAGAWGWGRFEGPARWLAAVGLPLLLMVAWGTFAVPNDPSRGGSPPVVVPGVVRLAVELAVFGAGTAALVLRGNLAAACIYATALAVHHAVSWDRLRWLLSQ